MGLRTKEGSRAYTKAMAEGILDHGCPLCKKDSTKEFEYWRIVVNDYPYDLVASKHDMIVSKRHVSEPGLSEEEKVELLNIKENYIHKEYDYTIEATHRKKSIPEHFHLHLIVSKN